MSTSAPAFIPSAEQLQYLETTLLEVHEYNPWIQRQFDAGLLTPEKAGRMFLCGTQITCFKDGEHVWNMAHYCMAQDCPACADRRAQVEFHKYSLLASECPHTFCYFEFSHYSAKKCIKLLSKLGPVLAKAGHVKGRVQYKALLLLPIQAIPERTLRKLQQWDIQMECEAHDREEFDSVLKRVLKADLPIDLDDILILKGIKRRLTLQGLSREKRKLFVVKESTSTNNLTIPSDVTPPEAPTDSAPLPKKGPKCPHCGKPATHRTNRMFIGSPIGSEKWIPLRSEDPPEFH